MPPGTGVQVPREPATLQAWQAPVHALVQQTPSTQLRPEAHCAVLVHASPAIPRGAQVMPEQNAPKSHSAELAHIMSQSAP